MNIKQALNDFGVRNDSLTQEEKTGLDEKGYIVLPGVISDNWLGDLRDRFEKLCEGGHIDGFVESGTRRIKDLVNKGEVFDQVYTNPKVLAAVHHVIKRDFKLSDLSARDALPGDGAQQLHVEEVGNRPNLSQDHKLRFHVCNSIWLLDDFTRDNGCTRLVPGTHLEPHPESILKNRMAPHPKEEYLLASAGSVAVFNSHIWHGGTLNQTKDSNRRALLCYFTASEHKQVFNQREYIRYETWKRISKAARHILDVDLD